MMLLKANGTQEDREATKKMHNIGYVSVNTGATRLRGRRLFYIILGLLIGCALTVTFLRKSNREHRIQADNDLSYMKDYNNDAGEMHTTENGHSEHVGRPELSKDSHHAQKGANFEATDEWKEIPNDAILPHGLDVKLDFKTGQRMARKHQPKAKDESHLPVPVPTAEAQHPPEKTIIEQQLDRILSSDSSIQQKTLEALDEEAHQLAVGAAITHASNFGNLVILLGDGNRQTRLIAATIISASVHNNPSAVEGVLMTNHLATIVSKLRVESDSKILRRIVSILANMAELNMTGTRYQFVNAQGFDALDKILTRGVDHFIFERAMVFLALLTREEPLGHHDDPLVLLERHLPSAQDHFDEALALSFQPLCHSEVPHMPPRFPHIVAFYALLLQKQQAEQAERQTESQRRLERAAMDVDANFKSWLQFRDPFTESHERIMVFQRQVTGQEGESAASTSVRSLRHPNGSSSELTVRHLNESTDLDPTTFNLFRKLKYGD